MATRTVQTLSQLDRRVDPQKYPSKHAYLVAKPLYVLQEGQLVLAARQPADLSNRLAYTNPYVHVMFFLKSV